MQPVVSTAVFGPRGLTGFNHAGGTSQTERSGQASGVRHRDARHDSHCHSHHYGSRARQIFRQEFTQAFRAEFRSEINVSSTSIQAYRETGASDDTASDISIAARQAIQESDTDPSTTIARVRQSVSASARITREVVNTPDGRQAVDTLEGEINDSLDAIASDEDFIKASTLAIEARSRQRSTIRIRTQEGDLVKLDVRRSDRVSMSDSSIETADGTSTTTEVSVSSRSKLVLRVHGDLNDAELEAIRNVFAQAEDLADRFFNGDINAALDASAGLEFDSDQLARVSMRLRSSQQINVTGHHLQTGSPASAPGDANDTPAVNIRPDVTSGPATDADATVEPQVAPESAVAEAAETSESTAAATRPALDPLTGFLQLIAEYLQQSMQQFNDTMQAGSQSTRMRLDVSESIRLDILRAVMSEKTAENNLVAASESPAKSAQPDFVG